MKEYVRISLRWFLTGFLALLLVSSALREDWVSVFLLGLAVFATIPLADTLGETGPRWFLHPLTRTALVLAGLIGAIQEGEGSVAEFGRDAGWKASELPLSLAKLASERTA